MTAPLVPPPSVAREFGHDPGQRLMRANAAALAIVEAAAASAAGKIVALRRSGGPIMAREPWRITRAVYPLRPTVWPIPGKPATDVLADCARMTRALDRQRDAVPPRWTYDANLHVALRQAEDALLAIIMGDAPEPKEAA